MRTKRKAWKSAAARRIIELADQPATVEQAIEIVAARLLEGVNCPPTDLEALKLAVNVKAFEPVKGLPVSGELRKDEHGFVIAYSASLSTGRRRFTIAHELAHAAFEMTGPNCPHYGSELERICDMLASEILMPRNVFVEHVGVNASIDPKKVYLLARDFGTSLMATALRCRQLFGVSIFQVEKSHIAWGYGAVRHDRDMRVDFDTFQVAIARAMEGVPGERTVFVRGSRYILRWTCKPGEPRALFVLQYKGLRQQLRIPDVQSKG